MVKKMLEATQNDTTAYNKFILEYKKYSNTGFYFIEGDDFCYYNNRIKKYSKCSSFRNYSCGGKKNVISVRNMIANSKIRLDESNRLMFFVDRDYDFDIVPEDISVTEWYSIENFYLTLDLIKKVLENHFRLNEDEKNYIKALEYYEILYKEYSNFMRKLNVFLYTVRECEILQRKGRTDFNKVAFYKFIDKDGLENFKMKDYSYEELSKMYEISCSLDNELLSKNELLFFPENHYNFRGKFELDFLKYFLKLLRKALQSGNCGFSKIKVCKYDFQMDTMHILSEYAYTSENLKRYIEGKNIVDIKPIQYA